MKNELHAISRRQTTHQDSIKKSSLRNILIYESCLQRISPIKNLACGPCYAHLLLNHSATVMHLIASFLFCLPIHWWCKQFGKKGRYPPAFLRHMGSRLNADWLMIALITWNSNLVPLFEGLCSSNPCRFVSSVFLGFCQNRNDDLGIHSPALWPTELVLHHLRWCKPLMLYLCNKQALMKAVKRSAWYMNE